MLSLGSSEEAVLSVQYDSSYCVDKQSRNESQTIEIAYKEHPQKVQEMDYMYMYIY